MLQQTQVERVRDFYARFLKKFPSVQHLARASWEEILECWRGLGYYRRARNMHKAAQVLVNDFGGKFPCDFESLKKLPGVGAYTAAAIASFAFGEKVPAIDTNVARIFERIFRDEWRAMKPVEKFLFSQKYIGKMSSRDFNYALMDLGATDCTARQPKFEECCFGEFCKPDVDYKLPRMARGLTFADRAVDVKVAAGVLIHSGKILISKRPRGKSLAGLWEFPGGKLEAREDERQCLKRELMEELGVEVAVRPAFHKTFTEHDGTKIRLSFHRCSLLLGEPRALENQQFKWISPSELRNYEFPPANVEVIEILESKPAMFRV